MTNSTKLSEIIVDWLLMLIKQSEHALKGRFDALLAMTQGKFVRLDIFLDFGLSYFLALVEW
mgnify:CR=1 FL=1